MWYQRFEWKPGSRNSSTDTWFELFVRKREDEVLPKEDEEIYFQGHGGPVWRGFFRIPQIFVVLLALAEIELSIHVACVNDAWGNLASWSGIVTGIFLLVAVFTSALDIANSIFYITERRIIVYHRAVGHNGDITAFGNNSLILNMIIFIYALASSRITNGNW